MKKTLLLFLCSLIGLSIYLPCGAQEPAGIDSLTVRGSRFIPAARILLEFGVNKGDPLDREALAEGIRRLHRSRRYEEIDIGIEMLSASSAHLVITIKEYPRISRMHWEGLSKLKRKDLEEMVRVTTGTYVSTGLLARDEEAILQYCREEGYHAATVEPELVLTENGRATLTFKIDEGEKTKIKHLSFEGNSSISSGQLAKTVKSKPKRRINPLSWFNYNSYQPDSIALDVELLTHRYNQEGFLDARILDTRQEFNEKKDRVSLVYVIEEGEQYYFGDLSWNGNVALADSIIEQSIPIKSGDDFDGYLLDFLITRISEKLYDEGYLYNQIRPERRIEGDRVNLTISIHEGPLARVREVVIQGNHKTRDKVIRREVRIFPGELFNREKVMRSYRDIYMLRYFDDVQFEPRTNPETGEVDIIFKVKERATANFGAGITYSEATSLTGFLQLGAQNFLGHGQTVNFQWEFGSRINLFNLGFTEPWFRDRPLTLMSSIYRSRSNMYGEYYEDEKRGFSLGLGRPYPWLEYSRISASYRVESVKLFNFSQAYIDQGGTLVDRDWPEIESSLTLTFWRNSTDNPFLPSTGTRFRVTGKLAGGILGGSLDYQKYTVNYTWYQKLISRWVLRFHQTLGQVDGLSSPDQVPDQVRFRLGGNRVNPLRGYSDYSIVPEGNSAFFGGRTMTYGSVEMVFGVNNSIQIVAPFFDFGGTWNSIAQADFTTMLRSVGFGARIEVPNMGVLGFDWGYPMDSNIREKGKFHFKMGTDF
jgi:outer membrane protein insertion porin family